MLLLKTGLLFILTAIAEIAGCWFPYVVLREHKSQWLLLPGGACLMIFAWLLTFHPAAAGRIYAAYGGVYICVALGWLRIVEGISLTRWDLAGGVVALAGMLIIVCQPA